MVGKFDGETGRNAVESLDDNAFLGIVDEAVVDGSLLPIETAPARPAGIALFRRAYMVPVSGVRAVGRYLIAGNIPAIEELSDGDKMDFSVAELSAYLDLSVEEIEDILRLTGDDKS